MRFFADAQNDKTKPECVILSERSERKNHIYIQVVLYAILRCAQNDRTKPECVILRERSETKNHIYTQVVLYAILR